MWQLMLTPLADAAAAQQTINRSRNKRPQASGIRTESREMPPRRTQSLLNQRLGVKKPTGGDVIVKPAVRSISEDNTLSKPQLSKEEEANAVAQIIETETFKQAYAQLVLSQKHKPIHGENLNEVDRLLSSFDMAMKYGPCAGITRLKRYERATKLSQNPPKAVGVILNSPLGNLDRYSWSYIH